MLGLGVGKEGLLPLAPPKPSITAATSITAASTGANTATASMVETSAIATEAAAAEEEESGDGKPHQLANRHRKEQHLWKPLLHRKRAAGLLQ